MKFRFTIIFLIISIQRTFAQEDKSFTEGMNQLSRQEYKEAILSFTESIRFDPSLPKPYSMRGYAYLNLKEYNPALKDYLKYFAMTKTDAEACIQISYIFNAEGKYKKSLLWVDRAIALDPKNPLAYNNRGVTLQNMLDYKNAIANYALAIKYDSTFAMGYCNRGAAVFNNQDIAAPSTLDVEYAIKDFNKALELDPSLCNALENRASCFLYNKRYVEALIDANKAIACNPTKAPNYLVRGKVYIGLGEIQMALSDFKNAVQLNPGLMEAWFRLGKNQITVGDLTSAKESLLRCSADREFGGESEYLLATIYAETNEDALLYQHLNFARKKGWFKDKGHFNSFLKDKSFEAYRKDEEFKNFIEKIY